MKPDLGVCYYPEHWPKSIWPDDANHMYSVGIRWVRIGEFAWSRIEPQPGELHWAWLDDAIEILGNAGLKVVLGTPTATPPRWMIDRHPDMLAVDAAGNPRKFGSRRHYCFSHEGYAKECDRIVELIAKRYGGHPHIHAWQTDNEYGCHDTTLSYSDAAHHAFQLWLAQRYHSIDTLNGAWGNVFWSMEYDCFEQIELPNLTVTEANPAHSLAFRRFSSDQVAAFNRRQTQIIRSHCKAPISHNFMGGVTDFDHFNVASDLDIATWDSYPLGFLEDRIDANQNWKQRFFRQGDPDYQAFHHDLYRAVGRGRWWVMEQQPGPVNWAPYNPDPLPGMVKLWSLEAFAHGAQVVSYFRWRQSPFAQEQMHAGLLRPDSQDAPAMDEVKELAEQIRSGADIDPCDANIAILFDYGADSAWSIQPHSAGLTYLKLVFAHYRALRSLGLSIDIVPPSQRDFAQYSLILAPGLIHMPDGLKQALANSRAQLLLGPRSAARNEEFTIPTPLPPNFPGLDLIVSRAESLRPDTPIPLEQSGEVRHYREMLESPTTRVEQTTYGDPVVMAQDNITYVGGCLDHTALVRVCKRLCQKANIETLELPDGVRIRDTQLERFWFNYNANPQQVPIKGGIGKSLAPISILREPRPNSS